MGDFVLTGGELAAMAVIDSVSRLIPGVLNKEESFMDESFSNNLLEYPQYTRPEEFMGRRVPDILLSGHHKNIDIWRKQKSIERTFAKRPELLEGAELDEKEMQYLNKLREEK
jgi:tRNA (guanine37-N1)-methyltransferase